MPVTTPTADSPVMGDSCPPSCCALDQRHIEILDHTVNRAASGRYCGGGETMQELVDIGLMRYVGKMAWCPDQYYEITDKGREQLSLHNGRKLRAVSALANLDGPS